MQTKVNLERILFVEIDKMKVEFPDENWYSNEEMKALPEFKYFMDAMKQACKQVLELAAENAKIVVKTTITDHKEPPYMRSGESTVVDKQSITDTIKQVE